MRLGSLRRLGPAVSLSLVCIAPHGTHAGISGAGGDTVVLSPPPPSVASNALESNSKVFAFAEVENLMLPSPLGLDISLPGSYNSVFFLSPGQLQAGTRVNSYLLHSDPVGTPIFFPTTFDGFITFEEQVLGLLVRASRLAHTDDALGSDETAYPTGHLLRGLELGFLRDQVQLSADRRTLWFHLTAGLGMDQLRVITNAAQVVYPTADAGGPYEGEAGVPLEFDGSASNPGNGPLIYQWDFDWDGTFFIPDEIGVDLTDPTHVYDEPGDYTAALRVIDPVLGTSPIDTASVSIAEAPALPSADAGGPYSGEVGEIIQFSGSATNPGNGPLTFEWDFDWDGVDFDPDASGIDLTEPTHVYDKAGEYTAALRVTDPVLGTSPIDSATVTITVEPVVGLVLGSDTTTMQDPADYGKPNQVRLWFNSERGRWDAVVPRNDGGASASDHYVMLDVAGAQKFTGVEVEDRNTARPDVFWDDKEQVLWVLGSHPTTSRISRVIYDGNTDSYSLDPLVTNVTVTGLTHLTANVPATLYRSPNGHLWAAVMKDGRLDVQHSTDDGQSWLASPVLLDATVIMGVTRWTHFEHAGTTYVGVFAGENGEEDGSAQFFFHTIAQDDDPLVLANWTSDPGIPAPVGAEGADDHVSAARDAKGNLYFAVKTEGGEDTDPLIKLYKRTPDGVWSQFTVTETQENPEQTRPCVVVNDDESRLTVYMTATGGGTASRKQVALDDLSSLAGTPLVEIVANPGDLFDDLIAPRESVGGTSGTVVLVHNETDHTVWFRRD